ncbi:MAG: UDP-3-O-acyl-N-acetylglucosamine deacetylase [Proteobacteria bacterium]|jgi:UDP-3-O-[3-hydroxymyristoyl] N-acetylglucosamine deacetylase|nr:UDP-3-O-acyl-N-acetylglucosamine deacetylase [Pseudomonadota bacterium]
MDAFRPFSRDGVGIHSGERCSVRVSPGEAGSGVLFATARGDVPLCPASIAGDSRRATDLALGGARVRTVEHLAAALAWFGVRDARIEVGGPEIPILDGSAAPWVAALAGAGAIPGPAFLRIREPVRASLGNSTGEILPLDDGDAPVYEVSIDFDGADVGPGRASFRPLDGDFAVEIAPARSFALERDVAGLRGEGLARGGSLENALVLGAEGPLNPEGMRFPDEPARHKLLDAVGDLAILGGLPWARVSLVRPSHALHHALVTRAAQLVEGGAPYLFSSEPGLR